FTPRWLNASQTATYVGERQDRLPRLVRAGKLPTPSYHFGPRSPRWDRLELDALFLGSAASAQSIEVLEQEAVDAITRRARARRAAPAGLRRGPRIPLRPTAAQSKPS